MKTQNLIFILAFSIFISTCNVFSPSNHGEPFDYQFKTEKSTYSSQDTINASFKNESSQVLFLSYQICTITDMQKLETENWKSVPIPIFCTAEAKAPIQVKPGKKIDTGVNLQVFDKHELESGTYRLDVIASYKNGNEQRELVSNNFEIGNK